MVKALIQNILSKIAVLSPEYLVAQILQDKMCSAVLFHQDFLNSKCLGLAISKALGYVMLLGSFFYKLPIILKIFKAKGGDGLNIVSVYLETSAYLSLLLYNTLIQSAFSTYGDLFPATFQNMIIISLIWLWGIDKKKFSFFHILVALFAFGSFTAIILGAPKEHWHWVAKYSIVVTTISRLPQIISNFRAGKVGVQSAITLTNGVLGAVGKVYITYVETKDPLLIIGACFALGLNLILLTQVVLLQSGSNNKNVITTSTSRVEASKAIAHTDTKQTPSKSVPPTPMSLRKRQMPASIN